ncbi:MAG: DNA (cytosine-5-)-methyltransferase [bacterium]|nr:DNA (cytosine-5-)-methyltransferase [bacterium]
MSKTEPKMARAYGVTLRRTAPLRLHAHVDAPSPDEWSEWARGSDRPIAIDLFCGAGGLSEGLESAGFRVALAVDLDEWALETHAHNFPGLALCRDLAEESVREEIARLLEGVDVGLIAGGPPCQPYSRAGRSKIRSLVALGVRGRHDVRRELWRAFVDLVERVRPRAVVMENVPDMALGDDMVVLRVMLDSLERAGYEVDARIMDTWLYGVPQHRQRLILAGVRAGAGFAWPEATEQITVRDAIGDLPVLEVMPDAPIGAEVVDYGTPEMSDFAKRARKGCVGADAEVVFDHHTRAVRADDYEAFRMMTSDTLYSALPDSMKRYRDDIFNDKYNRLDWSSCARSITAHIAKDGYWYIHPEQHRTLTVREAARLQTFPDTFRFAGSRSHRFRQIGNAVPPVLGELIGSAILDGLRGEFRNLPSRSASRATVRDRLGYWATQDAESAPWAYPGDPWPVAVGLIVPSRGVTDVQTPSDVLGVAPTLRDATPKAFEAILGLAIPGPRRRAVERLASAVAHVRERTEGWDSDDWYRLAGLGPTGRNWFALMTGRSKGLVASAGALRVTARVTGTEVDARCRNSAGRIELAKLIGGGDDAALLNVAMHRLGQSVCTPSDPACGICPVRAVCLREFGHRAGGLQPVHDGGHL